MRDKKAVAALVNIFDPLLFVETGDELNNPELFRLLCAPNADLKPAALVERYKRILSAGMEPAILPALPMLIEKVVSPLVSSKAAFVAGNPLGTIALCGFVAEMIALMLYEMARDEGRAADVTMDQFEHCGQKERVKILHGQDIINQETKEAFDLIRDIRRRYIHFISKDHSLVFEDALRVYAKSISLLIDLVGQEFHNGAWVPKPSFERYLTKHGLL